MCTKLHNVFHSRRACKRLKSFFACRLNDGKNITLRVYLKLWIYTMYVMLDLIPPWNMKVMRNKNKEFLYFYSIFQGLESLKELKHYYMLFSKRVKLMLMHWVLLHITQLEDIVQLWLLIVMVLPIDKPEKYYNA